MSGAPGAGERIAGQSEERENGAAESGNDRRGLEGLHDHSPLGIPGRQLPSPCGPGGHKAAIWVQRARARPAARIRIRVRTAEAVRGAERMISKSKPRAGGSDLALRN